MNENSNLEFRKIKSLNFLYEINSNGTILRNVKSKKQLSIKLDTHHSTTGYYASLIHNNNVNNGSTKRVMIHKLVAECWLGQCPDGYQIDHIDRNSHNNDYRNLRYVTKSEQMINRDHTKIAATGSKNLEVARKLRAKPVKISNQVESYTFDSYADCSRFLANYYNVTFEHIRWKLKANRSKIYDFNIEYLPKCRD